MIESLPIPVAEAASELRVDPRRVRAMIEADQLDARKVAGRWLVDRHSLARQRAARRPGGRPFSAASAFALLFMAAGREPGWVSVRDRSRLRRYLEEHEFAELAPRMRQRARVLRLRAHPSDLERIGQERGVVRSGVSAAHAHGIDVYAPGVLEAYVRAGGARRLVRKYHAQPSGSPNLILHVVDGVWPFARDDEFAPASVAALDLAEADDQRSRRAGQELLESVMRS